MHSAVQGGSGRFESLARVYTPPNKIFLWIPFRLGADRWYNLIVLVWSIPSAAPPPRPRSLSTKRQTAHRAASRASCAQRLALYVDGVLGSHVIRTSKTVSASFRESKPLKSAEHVFDKATSPQPPLSHFRSYNLPNPFQHNMAGLSFATRCTPFRRLTKGDCPGSVAWPLTGSVNKRFGLRALSALAHFARLFGVLSFLSCVELRSATSIPYIFF